MQFEFKATGFYKYFIIGNFNSDKRTKKTDTNCECEQAHEVYATSAAYFIDNLCLTNTRHTILDTSAQVNSLISNQLPVSIEIMHNAPILLNRIYFDFNRAVLLPKSIEELNKVASLLKSDKNTVIEIAGHSDSSGDSSYNMNLSQQRAEAVRNYLLENEVTPNQPVIKYYGDKQPLVQTTDSSSSARNRRVEISIIRVEE